MRGRTRVAEHVATRDDAATLLAIEAHFARPE
jgi:hypothetical protein